MLNYSLEIERGVSLEDEEGSEGSINCWLVCRTCFFEIIANFQAIVKCKDTEKIGYYEK